MIRFLSSESIQKIRVDQVAAKQFFLAACSSKIKASWVQIIELHKDTPTLDNVEEFFDKKVMKELKKIEIDRLDKKKYFMIGTSLPATEEKALIKLLMENLEVFAWTLYDMP